MKLYTYFRALMIAKEDQQRYFFTDYHLVIRRKKQERRFRDGLIKRMEQLEYKVALYKDAYVLQELRAGHFTVKNLQDD